MAGNKKGKSKKQQQQQKKREKSNNPQKSNPKVDVGETSCDRYDHVSTKKVEDENQIEALIYEKIEEAYKEVCGILLDLNYTSFTIHNAMLAGGFIFGDGNFVSNILKNCVTYIDSCPIVDGKHVFDKVPIFDNLIDLIRFWIHVLVTFAVQMYPNDSKCDAMRHILSCKSLEIERISGDYNLPKVECSSSKDGTDFDVLVKENIHNFEEIRLTFNPEVLESDEEKDDRSSSNTTLVNREVLHPMAYVESNQLGEDLDQFDQFHLKSFESLPQDLDEESSFEEWLSNSTDDKKDDMILKLENLAIGLEEQITKCKEWAENKVREAIQKERQNTPKLNVLRAEEKLESEELKMMKKEVVNSKITKMVKKGLEHRKENDQLVYLDGRMIIFEAEKSEMQADVSAVKVADEEIKRNLKGAVKKEKEEFKKIENSEKQISKLEGQIQEEKEMLLQMEQQLHLVDEAQRETKMRLKHEQEEREKANDIRLEERRLTRIAKENAKQRLAALNQSLEMELKLAMDHKLRLMGELSDLMMPHLLSNENDESSSSSSSHVHILEEGESSQDNTPHEQVETIPNHRRCIFCLQREVCVLFMPCAHMVVCLGCSAHVRKNCPCCQVEIAKKIRVYGGNS